MQQALIGECASPTLINPVLRSYGTEFPSVLRWNSYPEYSSYSAVFAFDVGLRHGGLAEQVAYECASDEERVDACTSLCGMNYLAASGAIPSSHAREQDETSQVPLIDVWQQTTMLETSSELIGALAASAGAEAWSRFETALRSAVDCAIMIDISSSYEYRNTEAVEAFLKEHGEMLWILGEAKREIDARFENCRVTLDVFVDPEEELPDSLVVRIDSDLPAREAIARKARLHDEWWTSFIQSNGHKEVVFAVGRLT